MDKLVNRKLFILGCGRSGTSMLHRLIATHSYFVGVQETELLKFITNCNLSSLDIIDKVSLSNEESSIVRNYIHNNGKVWSKGEKGLFEFLDSYCESLRLHYNKKAYVEKSPIHTYFGDGIYNQIPDSRFIIMIRDPRSIVVSRTNTKTISRGKTKGIPKKLQFYLNLSEVLFTYKGLNTWYLKNDNRIKFVFYEQLVLETEKTLGAIFEFLEFPYEPVHENINPTDIRLASLKTNKLMNSSFNPKNSNTISEESLRRWDTKLSKFETSFIESCFKASDIQLVSTIYPDLQSSSSNKNILVSIFNLLNRLDYSIFLRKNIESYSHFKRSLFRI